MVKLSVEHILLFVVAAFLLYYLMGNCGCRNGFRVGAQPHHLSQARQDAMARSICSDSNYNPNTISRAECCRRFNLRCPLGPGH